MIILLLACNISQEKLGNIDSSIQGSSDSASLEFEFDCSAEHQTLTAGVDELQLGDSLPSDYILLSASACPIVWDDMYKTVVASSEVGNGKTVFFGHEGMLSPSEDDLYLSQLFKNALEWSGGVPSPIVGIVQPNNSIQVAVEAAGASVASIDWSQLNELDVLIMHSYDNLDGFTQTGIADFLAQGGGVLVGGHAWWWAYSNPSAEVAQDYPSAWLGHLAGIQWTTYSDVSSHVTDLSESPPSELQHPIFAMRALSEDLTQPVLDQNEIGLGTFVVGRALDSVPLDEAMLFDPARDYSDAVGPIQPTPDAPLIPAVQPIQMLSAQIEAIFGTKDHWEQIQAHPSSSDFPGNPTGASPCRGHIVSLDGSYSGRDEEYIYGGSSEWVARSTGVYALPGAPVELLFPESLTESGFEIAIGSHSDTLWHKEEIERFPSLVRREKIEMTEMKMASAFGGLVLIWIPSGADLGSVDIEISGGVFAPLYIHGETTLTEWAEQRNHPAPFGELISDGLTLTLPTSELQNLDDPIALMDFYSSVMDATNTFENRPIIERVRSERVVFDRQISAGWMHSGYPIMAHLESVSDILNLSFMQNSGDWGLFHELGHNHQWADWILPGTTESTCNLFSLYNMEETVGIPSTQAHSALTPDAREERMQTYLESGAHMADWNVWVALESYLQLKEAFGWPVYQDILLAYRELPAEDRPTTDQQRIDLWVQTVSEQTQFNMVPFYQSWGLPISQDSIDAVSILPTWTANPMEN